MKEASPGPAAEYGVDHGGENRTIDQIGNELGPFGHGTRDNGGCGGGKYHLKHPEGEDPGITAWRKFTQKEAGSSKPTSCGGTKH